MQTTGTLQQIITIDDMGNVIEFGDKNNLETSKKNK
jgi:hypothetical protein